MRPLLLCCICLLIWNCKQSTAPEAVRDFRQDMRDFVQGLSAWAKVHRPGFAVVIQNGHQILTDTGQGDGQPAELLIAAIDAVGRESLFYGYPKDDRETRPQERDRMLALTEVARQHDLTVLVTDYCSTPALMDDSYARNAARGYASFAADHRSLDNIPAYPEEPFNRSTGDIDALRQARNFLYLIDPGEFSDRSAFIDALAATDYDLLIVDLFYDRQALSADEVERLKHKAGGGRRLVIAYMSVGEAEDYRYYFNPEWVVEPPAWMDAENPDWEGNYKVRYWEEEWQAIVYGGPDAYLQKILDAGFDGTYLDIIDAFEYFERRAGVD